MHTVRKIALKAELTSLRVFYKEEREFFRDFFSELIEFWKNERRLRKFAAAKLVEEGFRFIIDNDGYAMDFFSYLCVSNRPVLPIAWFSPGKEDKGKFLLILLCAGQAAYFYAGSSHYYAKISFFNAYSDVVSGKKIYRYKRQLFIDLPAAELHPARTILRVPDSLLPHAQRVIDIACPNLQHLCNLLPCEKRIKMP